MTTFTKFLSIHQFMWRYNLLYASFIAGTGRDGVGSVHRTPSLPDAACRPTRFRRGAVKRKFLAVSYPMKTATTSARHQHPMGTLKHRISRGSILVLIALALCPSIRAVEPIEIFRTGDELIVKLDRFDLLREANPALSAELKIRGSGKVPDKTFPIDLSDPAVKGPLVIDLSKFGNLAGVSLTVRGATGNPLVEKTVAPVPEIPVKSNFPVSPTGAFAHIELGTAMDSGAAGARLSSPKIQLPDAKTLRSVQIDPAKRSLSKQDITFPVITQGDAPLRGGAVLVGRQTSAPKDATKASLYVSYKKAIYEGEKLDRWQKFLVEVPIQKSWGEGRGNETVQLASEVEVHVTNQVKEKDWRGRQRHILGEGDDDLGQTLSAIDDDGRIYFIAEYRVVRFDPNTKKFECSPPFDLQKLCPGGNTMKGSPGWLSGNLTMVCTRGRVFLIDILDYKTHPQPPGIDVPQRRIGGVFSIPQDWSDANAFSADVRLHVGSWETANPTLYKTPPVAGASTDERKLGKPMVTEAGLLIVSAGKKTASGPWRLDLDDKGNNQAFGESTSPTDAVSKDGSTKFAPTQEAMVNGVSKAMVHLVGNVYGRHLVGPAGTDGFEIPRASIRQLLMSDGWNASMLLPRTSDHAFRTYAGAPEGSVTVKYEFTEKLKAAPEAQGALADALRGGPSLGPVFLVTPVPGEPDKAVAICDYATYPLSIFDFSSLADKRAVLKTAVPAKAALATGLGAYDSAWDKQGDEQWLYITGYTGMTRIQYSKGGKVLEAMTSDIFHTRMAPQPVDGHVRGGLKQYDRIFPVFGGRMLDSGTGRPGRGGTPFATGLEIFDLKRLAAATPTDLIPSQTAAYLSRSCGALGTLQSRMVWNAHDGSRRQEIFGTGRPIQVYVDELDVRDKALVPGSLNEKVFNYEVSEHQGLRDLFGFSLPLTERGESVGGYLALSPCQRFLIILTEDGTLYTYSIAGKQFIDGVKIKTQAGEAAATIGFRRPGENIITAPDGQQFFLTAPAGKDGTSVQFNRLVVGQTGLLSIEPYLRIDCADGDDWQDLRNCVRCFLPDLKNKDGSIDFVIGWDSKDRAQAKPFVRVITDFIPPAGRKLNP